MGVGAGRNVAQSDVLASILSDTARQQGVVTIRLKKHSRSDDNGASTSGVGMYERRGFSEGNRKLLSIVNGALLGESAEDMHGGDAAERRAVPGEISRIGKRRHVSEVDKSDASLSKDGALPAKNGGGVVRRLSPIEEIKRFQSMSDGHVEITDGEGEVFEVNFQVAARAAAALLEQSQQGQGVQLAVDKVGAV